MRLNIAVVGAGAWGTALAIHLARKGWPVDLITHTLQDCETLRRDRMHRQTLPGIVFPESLTVHAAPQRRYSRVLIATPSVAFAETLQNILPFIDDQTELIWATKGLSDGKFLHEVAAQILPCDFGVVSGPSFAVEVAKGEITAVVLASAFPTVRNDWQEMLSDNTFRVYFSEDLIGVALGGTLKNLYGFIVGVARGLGLGANARAAILTRALAEMLRFGKALGAHPETLLGLSGAGDLFLTANDTRSRNYACGELIGKGVPIPEALPQVGGVVESIHNLPYVISLAHEHQLDMPLLRAMEAVVVQGAEPAGLVSTLMDRPAKFEY